MAVIRVGNHDEGVFSLFTGRPERVSALVEHVDLSGNTGHHFFALGVVENVLAFLRLRIAQTCGIGDLAQAVLYLAVGIDLQRFFIDLAGDVESRRREIMAAITDDQVIKFSPAEIKYSVSVFTDVDCTYCRRLHSQIDDYLAKGIEVRYLMYPRNGPASRAWNTAEEIWCSTDRKNALTMAKLDRKFSTSSCDATMVEDHFAMGRNIGLSGTPAILFDDGTLIAGYLAPDQLVSALEENAK